MNKPGIVLVAAAAVFTLATSSTYGGLGVVEIPQGRRAEATGLGLEAYRDIDGYIFAPMDAELLARLADAGWHAEMLDAECRAGSYYLVPHTKMNRPGAPGQVLWDGDRHAIVRLGEGEANRARDDGWLLVPLGPRARPLTATEDARYNWRPDTAVERMTAMVSLDTLMRDIRHLQDYVTRYSYSPKCESAARWVADELSGLGWEVALDTYYLQQPRTRALNVEATWPGLEPDSSVVIACAHLDSYTRSGMTEAPGADDNATGTAILLELARVLREYRFRRTIKLLAFSGEEQWMKGSYHWVDSVAVPQGMDIEIAFNVDMIGYDGSDENECVINTDVASRPFAALAESVNAWYGIDLVLLNYLDVDLAGDNSPFWDAGFKSTFALEDSEWGIWYGSNPHYHTNHDTVGLLSPHIVHGVGRITAASVATVAGPVVLTGVEEPGREPPARGGAAATILTRGSLTIREKRPAFLLDGAGRLATVLHPGVNDLEGVAPGIYFLRTEGAVIPLRRVVRIR